MALSTTLRRRLVPLLSVAAIVATASACLPTPADIVAFGCGRAFDQDDHEAISAYIDDLYPGYNAGLADPPEVIYANLQALASMNSSALAPYLAGVWVDADLVRAVVGVAGNVENMTTIIEAITPYPDEVVVEDRSADADLAADIWGRIQAAGVDDDAPLGTRMIDFLRDGVAVRLPPTGDAADLAARLRSDVGDRVSLTVGSRRLAGGPEFDTGPCVIELPRWVIGAGVPDNVVTRIVVDTPSVAPGATVRGHIEVTNNGAATAYAGPVSPTDCRPSDQPLTTTDRQFTVNGSTVGAAPAQRLISDVGEGFPLRFTEGRAAEEWMTPYPSGEELPSVCPAGVGGGEIRTGETISIPFIADTQSSRPTDGVTLPPGDYLVRPMLWIQTSFFSQDGPVALPPAPVTIATTPG